MKTTKEKKKKIIGLHRSGLVEALAFLTILVAGNIILGTGDRFIDISPHPFWVIILLITVQYGTIDGIASVVLCTIFLYAGNLPPEKISENIFEYQARLAALPSMWFAAAYFLGEIRMRLQYQIEDLTLKENDLKNQLKRITEGYEALKEKKEKLETRFARQTNSLAKTYEILKELETLDPAELLLSVDKIIQEILNVEKFSIFVLGEQGFEPLICSGWTEEDKFNRRFDCKSPLFTEIMEKRRLLSIINEEDEKILSNEGIVVTPLIDKEADKILGLIKIEKIDYFELSLSTLETFKKIGELISAAYVNARHHKIMRKQVIYSPDKLSFSYSLYGILTPTILEFCQSAKTPCSEVQLSCSRKNVGPVCEIIQEKLNIPKLLFEGKDAEKSVLLILPGTTEELANQITLELLDELKALQSMPDITYQLKVQALGKKETEKDRKSYVK